MFYLVDFRIFCRHCLDSYVIKAIFIFKVHSFPLPISKSRDNPIELIDIFQLSLYGADLFNNPEDRIQIVDAHIQEINGKNHVTVASLNIK
jgi:hypothetical protein